MPRATLRCRSRKAPARQVHLGWLMDTVFAAPFIIAWRAHSGRCGTATAPGAVAATAPRSRRTPRCLARRGPFPILKASSASTNRIRASSALSARDADHRSTHGSTPILITCESALVDSKIRSTYTSPPTSGSHPKRRGTHWRAICHALVTVSTAHTDHDHGHRPRHCLRTRFPEAGVRFGRERAPVAMSGNFQGACGSNGNHH